MSFTYENLREIFEKATTVPHMDERRYRKDLAGAIIAFDEYSRESSFGWEVDYIFPISMGGKADRINLRPLHWRNKLQRSENYPHYHTAITSDNRRNMEKLQAFTVNRTLQEELKELYQLPG